MDGNRALAELFITSLEARDWDVWAGLLHPAVVYEIPQSRERIRGRDRYLQFNQEYPGDWHLRPKVVIADERHGVVWFEWRLDNRTDDAMAFFEFTDGLITRVTDFWPEPYEPPPGREHLVERWLPAPAVPIGAWLPAGPGCSSWSRSLLTGTVTDDRSLRDHLLSEAFDRTKIVWLDCCYAGLAPPDREATPDKKDPPELLEVAEVEGTYLLAAAQKYEEAKSPDGEGCTAFTGELVNALRDGIAPGPPTQEFLSLNSLHQQVRSALRKKHLPEPNRHDPDNIGQLPHFHNMARRPGGGSKDRLKVPHVPVDVVTRALRRGSQ